MKKELRLIEILKILLNNENYLKAKDIASKLGVTIRTIYSDLDSPELNKIIYPGFIEKKTNKGIRIQIDPIMSIPLSEVHAIRYRSPHNPLKKSIFFES